MIELYICDTGSKFWHLNGEHHRANGPAITIANNLQE